jgi:hypothetical protein
MKTMQATHNCLPATVNVTDEISALLEALGDPKRGQFAYVSGHVSGLDDDACLTTHVSNIMLTCAPRYDKYLQRLQAKIRPIGFKRFEKFIAKAKSENMPFEARINGKLAEENAKAQAKGKSAVTLLGLFEACKAKQLADIAAKLAGTFESASAEAHNVCYATVQGWKCHLVTETNPETGRKEPVLTDGLPTVRSVMLPFYQVRRWTITDGEWRHVNSASKTLVNDAIERMTRLPMWKTFSLQKGNFSKVSLASETIVGWATTENVGLHCTAVDDDDAEAIGQLAPNAMTAMAAACGCLMPAPEVEDTPEDVTAPA